MKDTITTIKVTTWSSDIDPDITTTDKRLSEAMQWADEEYPIAYRIVSESKSRDFGFGSNHRYLGYYSHGTDSADILERLDVMKYMLTSRSEFDRLRVQFTLDHYEDEGFTGGFFAQYAKYTDGIEYIRSNTYLDFTPDLLEVVLDRFVKWMDPYYALKTTKVMVDDDIKRTFTEEPKMLALPRQAKLFRSSKIAKVRSR